MFPFIITGILSILFTYLIAASWFNKTTGLMVAASMAFLIFPLTHSQIARPYSLGLCFSLMSVWFWTLVLFKPKPYQIWKIAGYCITTAMSMYTHYFSFFLVMVVAVTGLFFLTKENYKRVIWCAVITFLLFLPHFDISLTHVQIGGFRDGGWLGPPDLRGNWFWDYLLSCFNESLIVLLVFFGIFFFFLRRNYREIGVTKFHLFAVIWFLVPFLVGYYYSIMRFPVLQKSVLLFSFPYILIFLFSFVPNTPWSKTKTAMLTLFLSLGVFSTVVAEKFYQTHHFGVLKDVVQDAIRYVNKYGDENITKTTNVGLTYFVGYYMDKYDHQIEWEEYDNGETEEFKYVNQGNDQLGLFSDIISESETPYFLYCWSSKYSPSEIPEMIRDKYPYLLEQSNYFNAESYLYGKEKAPGFLERNAVYTTECGFENPVEEWTGDQTAITESVAHTGSRSFKLSDKTEFSLTFVDKVKNIMDADHNVLNTSAWGYFEREDAEAVMVITLSTENGEEYVWRGMNFSYFIDEPQTWTKIFHSWRFDYIRSGEDIIKVYIWNPNKHTVYVDDVNIEVTTGNSLIYGRKIRSFD